MLKRLIALLGFIQVLDTRHLASRHCQFAQVVLDLCLAEVPDHGRLVFGNRDLNSREDLLVAVV